jgi:predicted nucleic acid-binding protein
MGTVVLDTNVLIGVMDPADDLHASARRGLAAWLGPDHDRLIPTIVYSELLVHPIRAGVQQAAEDRLLRLGVNLIALDTTLARRSAEIRARFGSVTLGDAVVLATALEHGSHLLTFDAQMQLAWERVR